MILLFLLALMVPYLTGAGWLRLRIEKERTSPGQSYLMGVLTIFLMAQAASFITIKGNLSFDNYCIMLAGAVGVATLVSLAVGWKQLILAFKNENNILNGFLRYFTKKQNMGEANSIIKLIGNREQHRITIESLVILLVVLLQLAAYILFVPDTGSSTMGETISVTTATGTVFSYNPVTGALLERGIYPVYKLASIPIFYSALYRLSGLSFPIFVYTVLPIWVLLVGLTVMILWGEVLSRGIKERRVLFLMFYSLMVLLRGGVEETFGYLMMHEAFKGKTLATAVLIPLFFCGLYLFVFQKEKLYGTAMSFLSLSGIVFSLALIWNLNPGDFIGSGNREWSLLFLLVVVMFLLWDRSNIQWKSADISFLCVVLACGTIPESALVYVGTSYCLTRICDLARQWGKRKVFYVGSIIIICLFGTVIPMRCSLPMYRELPKEDIIMKADIERAREELITATGGEPIVLAPDHIMESLRCQGSGTRLLYGKDMWYQDCNREVADEYPPEYSQLHELMDKDYLYTTEVATMAANAGVNILVLREHIDEDIREAFSYSEPRDGVGYALYTRE